MTQCSTSKIGDTPLYKSCFLPIQVMRTEPLPASSKCKSGLLRITGWRKQSFRLRLWSLVWFQVRVTSHLRNRLESQHQSVPGCAEECGDPLVQSGGRWQTLGVAVGLGAGPQETQAWLQKEWYDFVPFSHNPLLPRPEPAGLLRLVIRREHHQHDLPQHKSHPPSIRRAPAGAFGKGMLPVPDRYRGGDWGWRWLLWIDVSSST